VIERARDDGTWESIFDETQLGELEIPHAEGCSRIEGPLLLACAKATRYAGSQVRTLLEAELQVDDDDSLRGTEYLLLPGEHVHLFGISIAPAEASGSPYRAAPPHARRTAEVPVVVITPWSFAELRREFRRRPEILPRNRADEFSDASARDHASVWGRRTLTVTAPASTLARPKPWAGRGRAGELLQVSRRLAAAGAKMP
jgi:hypothetical protein